VTGYGGWVPRQDFEGLSGHTVEQIWVWADTIRLVIELGHDAEPTSYVDVHSKSELVDGSTRATLDARGRPEEAGGVLRLLDDRITSAGALDGVLRLSFARGGELTSPPDKQYESWTVAVGGRVFQCMPGGEVNSW
jgi:hypothetical protein